MKRIATLLVATLAFLLQAIAYDIPSHGLRMITMDDGLASNAVRNVVQDKYGFIWFGTDNGLCRYDGIGIRPFRIAENGIDQYISALCSTEEGLVVGTGKGVYSYDFRSETFTRILPDVEAIVTHITQGQDGQLWIATKGKGLYCYTPHDGSCCHFPMESFSGYVAQVLVTAEGQVWAVTHTSASSPARLNKASGRFETMQKGESFEYGALAIMQAHDGTLWLGTWENGLVHMSVDGTLLQAGSPSVASSFRHIHTLVEYSPDCILVGCDEGLSSYNPLTGAVNAFHPSLPSAFGLRFVYSIHHDHEGGLWLGTFYSGVGYVSPAAHRFDSMRGGVISRFCEDGEGRVWIASDDAGLRLYLPDSHRYSAYPGMDTLGELNVHALCADGDDLWVGTYTAGVFVLNLKTGRLRNYVRTENPRSLDDFSSYAIHRDRAGRIWVATMNGLCLYDRGRDDFLRVRGFSSVPIDIDEDADGNLWFSTQGDGLWKRTPDGRWKRYVNTDDSLSLSDDQVNCACIDSGGRLWVGTQSGLCLYDAPADRFRRIRLDLPSQSVFSIVEDGGVLWLAGSCGVVKYEPGKGVCRFTRQDGLLCEQFQPNSGLKSAGGRIYFGTVQGFNTFFPLRIKVNDVAPPVFITSFELSGRPVEVGSKQLPLSPLFVPSIDLSWRESMFSFSFASLSYCSPGKNLYAYMLEGFDKGWNYVGTQHKATYTNIPAGTYTLRVKATNNDGGWSTSEARLRIVVHPPLWWSLPAKIAYLLLLASLVYYYVHYRLARAEQRHRRELRQLEEAKEREARDARLSFFTMVAHEIRTPVSLITGPLENIAKGSHPDIAADLDTIGRNATRLLELVGQLLDFRKVEQKAFVMHFAPENIGNLLRAVCERFAPTFARDGQAFTVVYPHARFTAIVDREALTKVVSNLLTNAHKYTRDSVRLLCAEEPGGDSFRIEVADNGTGIRPEDRQRIFAPFYQAQGGMPGTGIGLSIVKDIVDRHGGTIDVESAVGRGSTFTVVLPVSQAATACVPGTDGGDGCADGVADGTVPAAVPGDDGCGAPVAGRPVMLVVDDNEEMAGFLSRCFGDSFSVLTAFDGIEALSLVRRVQEGGGTIDVVVCDLMMPRMDGAELCRRLRLDASTSHIPFVMLTARTDSASKVEGMDAGADAYVEKPFSPDYLRACVRGLLDMRRRLRERFSRLPLEGLQCMAAGEADAEFLHRLESLIADNFSSPSLTVDFLVRELGISRSGLFSKLKSLSGMTPIEMIQVVRLKEAARLLSSGNYQVGEAASMVGFGTASYFSKIFFRQFGIRPAEFIRQAKMAKENKGEEGIVGNTSP